MNLFSVLSVLGLLTQQQASIAERKSPEHQSAFVYKDLRTAETSKEVWLRGTGRLYPTQSSTKCLGSRTKNRFLHISHKPRSSKPCVGGKPRLHIQTICKPASHGLTGGQNLCDSTDYNEVSCNARQGFLL